MGSRTGSTRALVLIQCAATSLSSVAAVGPAVRLLPAAVAAATLDR